MANNGQAQLRYSREGRMSSFDRSQAAKVSVLENIGVMRCRRFRSGRLHAVGRDSHKTDGVLCRRSCVTKRLRICDEVGDHHCVVFRRFEKTVGNLRQSPVLCPFLHPTVPNQDFHTQQTVRAIWQVDRDGTGISRFPSSIVAIRRLQMPPFIISVPVSEP